MMLQLQEVHTFYGSIHALHGISLEVDTREIVALIGANGAGKSTTLKTIVGWVHPRSGKIFLKNEPIDHLRTDRIVQKGISLVPEGRELFKRLTVMENLEMGAFTRKDHDGLKRDYEMIFALFPVLKARLKQKAKFLSGGEQQMLAVSRALMTRPEILLLDEPSLGLSPILVQTIFSTLKDINQEGITLFLVEQNALMALKTANRAYVLEKGTIAMHDTGERLQKNEIVRRAYLGVEK
jgi:branched-chain amino acid transport system ATP-binding protein